MNNNTKQILSILNSDELRLLVDNLSSIQKRTGWALPFSEYSIDDFQNDYDLVQNTLKEVCENMKIEEFGRQFQKSILTMLTNIGTYYKNANSNQSHFNECYNTIDNLKNIIYTSNLIFNQSSIPKYIQKLKEFETLNGEAQRIKNQLPNADEDFKQLKSLMLSSTAYLKEIQENLEKTKSIETKGEAIQNALEQLESKASTSLNAVISDQDKVLIIKKELDELLLSYKENDKSLKKHLEQIDTKLAKFEETKEDMQSALNTHDDATQKIISKNKELNFQLEEQIQKAVGNSLFGSFNTRKNELNTSLNNWLVFSGVGILIFIGLSVWTIYDIVHGGFNGTLFTMKIATSIPIVYAIFFTTSRYAKERRLVEEYAFKATISFALEPYSKLVEKITKESDKNDEYSKFIISSIKDIFSTPTDKAFSKVSEKIEDSNDLINLTKAGELIKLLKEIQTKNFTET